MAAILSRPQCVNYHGHINIFQYVNIHVNLLKIIPVLEMAWHQTGDQVLWHIQIFINSLRPSDAYILNLTILGSDNGLSPGRRHAIICQCWNIVNSNLRNKLQWNPMRNSFIFILENAFENVVCEMASIWSRPQWVNSLALWEATSPFTINALMITDYSLVGPTLIFPVI